MRLGSCKRKDMYALCEQWCLVDLPLHFLFKKEKQKLHVSQSCLLTEEKKRRKQWDDEKTEDVES